MAVPLILLYDAQHSLEYSCILMQKVFVLESLMENKLNRQKHSQRQSHTEKFGGFFTFTVTATLFSKIISQDSILSPALVFWTTKCLSHTPSVFNHLFHSTLLSEKSHFSLDHNFRKTTLLSGSQFQEKHTSLWISVLGEPHFSLDHNSRKTTLPSGSQFQEN